MNRTIPDPAGLPLAASLPSDVVMQPFASLQPVLRHEHGVVWGCPA
jgi:hypothetical protein